MPLINDRKNMYKIVKTCTNCKKRVPNNLKAGDKCPHCKVVFAREEGVVPLRDKMTTGGKKELLTILAVISIIGGIGIIILLWEDFWNFRKFKDIHYATAFFFIVGAILIICSNQVKEEKNKDFKF